ncbi:Auxin response factor 5 [Apostasia shenzhenica]|uniref:Auxin response factor 5 n=1 Tax=Apostasia shenzhenica TaxID=1088818 RepID=A0A2I0A7B1_9ASPA|nr:Auxin response factor 5 [Apostasia shenzhenica]
MEASVQKLGANDLSRSSGLQAQLVEQNNVHINAPRKPQQAQASINQLSTVSQPKQQIEDLSMQQRHQLINQTVSLNKSQIPIQQQPLLQYSLTHPQILVQNQIQQRQSLPPNQHVLQTNIANNSHMQKLQQKQSLLSPPIQQQPQIPQTQEHQQLLLESLQNPAISNRSQTAIPQQLLLEKLQQQGMPLSDPRVATPAPSTILSSSAGNSMTAGGTHSVLTDDVPSCSTSPSKNNCVVLPWPILNRVSYHKPLSTEKSNSLTATILNPISLESLTSINLTRELPKSELNLKPSVPIPKSNAQGVTTLTYLNNATEYLDSSSSATSVCLSQNDGSLHQNFPFSSLNQPQVFKDSLQDNDVQGIDPRKNIFSGGIPLTTNPLFANGMGSGKYQNQISRNEVADCVASKDAQHELSSSMVSHSFEVPDLAFNSIDSTIADSSIINRNSLGASPKLQRLRTYTKVGASAAQVYKRGAVGRSIDITRYSGYDELKFDLARMFSIEGQLEDRQRIGWKLVYVDHENDVLLVGDDPWDLYGVARPHRQLSTTLFDLQGVCELRALHQNSLPTGSPADEFGRRSKRQYSSKPSLQQLRWPKCLEGSARPEIDEPFCWIVQPF